VQVAQSLGQVMCDQLAEEVLRIGVDVWWVLDSSAQNVLVNLERAARVPERSETTQHFEDENTKRPPVQGQS